MAKICRSLGEMMESQEPGSYEREEAARARTRALLVTIFGVILLLSCFAILGKFRTSSVNDQWLRFFGRHHMIALHLPIGMMVLALCAEIWAVIVRRPAAIMPLLFTAFTAVIAMFSGLLLWRSNPENYDDAMLQSHMQLAVLFTLSVIIALIIKARLGGRTRKLRVVYGITLIAATALMFAAGHEGGVLTHGKNFLQDEMPESLRQVLGKPGKTEKPANGDANTDEVSSIPLEQLPLYSGVVQKILDNKCISCHGPEKQKGKLRMDSYADLNKGGKYGAVFTPGDVKDSEMLYRIHLPIDDDEHMPPEGKRQPTSEEVAVLTWWISNGAAEEGLVRDYEMDDTIRTALESVVGQEGR